MKNKVRSLRNSVIIIFPFLTFAAATVHSQPLASGSDKFLGNVYDSGTLPVSFESYWNQVTPGNAGKWAYVEPSRGVFSWSTIDQSYQYAKQRGIPFKYHNFVWGQQQPSWIMTLDSASQRHEVEEFIRQVGRRYPKMDFVDVVNEGILSHNPAQYRNALGGAGATGYDWIITAFQWARQYCAPGVKLLINDYGIINDNTATTTYLVIINLLKQRGLIDGIGVQGHRFEFENASTITLKANLDRLAATGLPIYISEFDVAPGNVDDEDAQATEMARIFPTLWTHPGVKGITFWGYVVGSMWQTAAGLVNPDGTERLAMQWLRNYLTAAGSYRSHQSGNWNDPATWESYNGSAWISPAPAHPSTASNVVAIKSGDSVTVASSDSIDQLWLSQGGSLVINSGSTLKVLHGGMLDVSGADMYVGGTVRCFGTLAAGPGAAINFGNGGSYIHERNGGALPIATWALGSTCTLDAFTDAAPANGNQNFYNLKWNSPDQTGDLSLGWKNNTIGGSITIQNTGSGSWRFCTPAAGEHDTIHIAGALIQSGGQATGFMFQSEQSSGTIIQNGDIRLTGGALTVGSGSAGSGIWYLDRGGLIIRNTTVRNDAGDNCTMALSGTDTTQTMSMSSVSYGPGGLPIDVEGGATLNIGTTVLKGDGHFSLKPGATIQTGHAGGIDSSIQTTGRKAFSTSANYVFNGIKSQVTGSLMPDTVSKLVLNCSQSVMLSKNLTVADTLELMKGSLVPGGSILCYGTTASLKYSGFMAQTTSDAEFPVAGGPKNLIVATQNGVTLHSSRAISGTVVPTRKLTLGANSLIAASASGGTTTGYVVTDGDGVLRLTSAAAGELFFPVGTASAYAPVTIGTTEPFDTLSAKVTADASPSPYGGRVNLRWTLAKTAASGNNYALRFGWLSSSENSAFAADRSHNAKIFRLDDSTEAGTGTYTVQFSTRPYTVWRGGITQLGTFGVGIFGTVTSSIDNRQSSMPGVITLRQNYPNPFNPSTTIGYVLPKESDVSITISNVLGAKIRTLIDTRKYAGSYTVVWDGTDDGHLRVASGLYFYTLRSAGNIITRKMLLLK